MPLGIANHSLNLANPVVVSDPRIFRGYVRSPASTTVSVYNTSGTALGTAFSHTCGTLNIIRTMKLPDSNNQIIAMAGNSGRRVLHFNATTNVYTSIYSSTAISPMTSCDITYNTTYDKFYVAWCVNTTSTSNRVRLSTGSLSSPTTAMTEAGLADPGAVAYSCAWTPNGDTLAVRTAGSIRTYYRAAGDVMTINATSYTKSGGVTGSSYEDISWNAYGTVLLAADDNLNHLSRYTLGSTGALTLINNTTVPGPVTIKRVIAAWNPNPNYAGVIAVGADLPAWTLMYFGSNGSGTFNTLPGNNGQLSLPSQPRQMRWSPTGDKIAIVYDNATAGARYYYSFTYSEGSTATVAVGGSSATYYTTSGASGDYAFDWIYY